MQEAPSNFEEPLGGAEPSVRLIYRPSAAHKWATAEDGPPAWIPGKEKCPEALTMEERGGLVAVSHPRDNPMAPRRWAVRRGAQGVEFYESKLTRELPDGTIEIHGHPTRRVPPEILRAMRAAGEITQQEYKRQIKERP